MIFKELGLLNFGKFENKIIKLEKGLNIIYGDNEKGKSTIVNFIDGIFYGFSRDSIKKKIRDDLFDKLKPWNSNLYKGYIILSNDKEYRISRDFLNDKLNILNLESGEEYGDLDSLYEFSRIPQPGNLFFEINRKIFKSSFFISQRLSNIEEDAYRELKTKINNFIVSSDENIDLNNVLSKMEEDLYNLGTIKRKSSEIGKLNSDLDKLYIKSSSYLYNRDNYLNAVGELKNKNLNLKKLNENLKGRKLYELNNLKNKLNEFKNNKTQNRFLSNLDDYEKAIGLNKLLSLYSNKLDSFIINDDVNEYSENIDSEEDYIQYRNIKDRIKDLNSTNFSKEMEIISKDLVNIKNKSLFYLLKIIVSIVISLLIISGSIYFKKYIFIILAIIPIIYSYFRILRYLENRDLFKRLKNKEGLLKKNSLEKTIEKQKYDVLFQKFYDKYNVNDEDELNIVLTKLRDENIRKKSQFEYNKFIKDKNNREFTDLKNKVENIELELENIFEKYKVDNISQLKDKFKDYKYDLSDEINKLKLKINELSSDDLGTEIYSEKSIDEINSEIRNEGLEISNLKGVISTLEDSMEKYRNLKEKSYELKNKLEDLNNKKDILELSIEKLKDFMKNKRKDNLPILKKNIENFLSKLTDSKYSKIVIDDKFNIKVYDNNVKNFIDISNLSVGTIDQIYLAFRLSIAKTISDKDIPIVLDSHFDSYDDTRLANALKLFENNNQTIVFTSTKREINILEKNNIDYNLIEI